MKRLLLKLERFLLKRYLTQNQIKQLILLLVKDHQVNLTLLLYHSMGVLKYENSQISGEDFFVKKILNQYLKKVTRPVLFDVGANTGEYTQMLAITFVDAHIYSFEPNNRTFEQLNKILLPNIKCFNIGLGAEKKNAKIYTYADSLESQHASLYKDVFTDIHHTTQVIEIDFQLDTIDNFCKKQAIDKIDFLKIDTEGHEHEVLKGASAMLAAGKILLIQFEFNEMNVISRVFLKDFYTLLNNYHIFRIDTNRLIPLFNYSPQNEIFQFQNLVAIHTSVYNNT